MPIIVRFMSLHTGLDVAHVAYHLGDIGQHICDIAFPSTGMLGNMSVTLCYLTQGRWATRL